MNTTVVCKIKESRTSLTFYFTQKKSGGGESGERHVFNESVVLLPTNLELHSDIDRTKMLECR